jgi:molybdate transport system substrate-binding protein
MRLRARALAAALGLASLAPARAADAVPGETLSVAGAANLSFALDALDAAFRRAAPEVALTSMTAASGDLVAQIEQGAPYDIFLSADLHFPQALADAGQADARTLATFAVGRLVLWTTRPDVALTDVAATVRDPQVRKLAIANQRTAPFGRAAEQALRRLGVWAVAEPKLVVGESVAQTAQFVATGNADAGFVALSVVLAPKLKGKGRYLEVSPDLYDPLDQGAIITRHGAQNPAARRYLAFLQGPAARLILTKFGYRLPPAPAPPPP